MFNSRCLCPNNQFQKIIEYKNETVFKEYEGLMIGRCTKCGLLKTIFTKQKTNFDSGTSKSSFYEQNKLYLQKLFQPLIQKVIKYKPRGKILDVGCSTGILLNLLIEKGFSVYGIEPNKNAFLLAHKKLGNKVFHGYLKQFMINNQQKFDIIIYNHVLEHIKIVAEELMLAKSILNKNGLLIIGVPNTQNIIFYLRKKYWESLKPNEHLWHFSKNYLISYLESKGFKILDVSFSDDERKDYPQFKQLYFKFLSLINRILQTGEAILIIGKKV
jgi:2-polyprenyl-3-methyl-5-hydroxy-6-metoxy-1,4-benzoquinol methylase